MRIGVDARLLAEPITGLGRYFYEVLSRMVEHGHEWYLYSHKPIIIGRWDKENIYLKTSRLNGRLARMLWAQTVLPYWSSKDALDLFWSPSHRLPRFLPNDIPSVVTIHDLVWRHSGETMRPLSRWLDSKLMPKAVTMANRVIVVSSNTAKDLEREMPDSKDKIEVIHLGVSKNKYVRVKSSLDSFDVASSYILFVGTLEPRKNLSRLISAYKKLPNSIKERVRLVVVGGKGWGRVDVARMVESLGLEKYVQILGYVTEEQLSLLYERALFLAMPSLYEGFGLPLIEAMSHGVPALTSNCSSMPEIAGDAAIFVDPYDEQSITRGMLTLIGDQSLYQALKTNAINNVKRFEWDKTASETLRVFEDASRLGNR